MAPYGAFTAEDGVLDPVPPAADGTGQEGLLSGVIQRPGEVIRVRALFKMDFAEAEYIARVRSGVKGHISYRRVAWEMRERIVELEPALGELIHATSPDVDEPLTR